MYSTKWHGSSVAMRRQRRLVCVVVFVPKPTPGVITGDEYLPWNTLGTHPQSSRKTLDLCYCAHSSHRSRQTQATRRVG